MQRSAIEELCIEINCLIPGNVSRNEVHRLKELVKKIRAELTKPEAEEYIIICPRCESKKIIDADGYWICDSCEHMWENIYGR